MKATVEEYELQAGKLEGKDLILSIQAQEHLYTDIKEQVIENFSPL